MCRQLAKLEAVQRHTTVEGIDNSHVRLYVVKLINVALSLLALLLIVINFAIDLLHPFVNSRSVSLYQPGCYLCHGLAEVIFDLHLSVCRQTDPISCR